LEAQNWVLGCVHLKEAIEKYPDAANEIRAWKAVVEGVRWQNFAEVHSMFKDGNL